MVKMYKYDKETYGFLSKDVPSIGQTVTVTVDGRIKILPIEKILECRKSKGKFEGEPPFFIKLKVKL